jgi:hypothetical protein
VLLCAYVVQDLLLDSRPLLRYGGVAEDFYDPIFLLETLQLPRLGNGGMAVVYVALVAASVLGLLGLRTRLSLAVAAGLYFYWFGSYLSYQWVYHPTVMPALALVVLAIAPSGQAYSLDAWLAGRRGTASRTTTPSEVAGWAQQALIVLLGLIYFSAGITKLRLTGLDWWTAGGFEVGILDIGTPFGRYLLERQLWAVHAMALFGLAFELCAPVLLFRSRLRQYYAVVAIAFHVATLAVITLNFVGWAVVCTVVFDLERLPAFLSAQVRSLGPRSRVSGTPLRRRQRPACLRHLRSERAEGGLPVDGTRRDLPARGPDLRRGLVPGRRLVRRLRPSGQQQSSP